MGSDLAAEWRFSLVGAERGWLWLTVGGVVVALLLALYRDERRLVSRPVGLALLWLRLAAALALVASLFEPVAARTLRETLRGRVIVGVDLSDSMETSDPGRPLEERKHLARLLGLSPAEPVETLPRREIVQRLVQDGWLDRLAEAHEVELIGFAREAVPATRETLPELLNRDRSGSPSSHGRMTDWSPVLAAGLRGTEDAPVIGVVLLTDGRGNAPGDLSGPLADRLAARGVPVFPVRIGSTVPPFDAAIAAIKASESVYKGDVATIDVTIKADAKAGTELPVTLEIPGGSPQRKTVRATRDGSRPVVTFRVPMEQVGPRNFTVTVGPLDGDVRPDNDRRDVTVQVADDQARVLLIDGEARWEFRYLRNALVRDPRVAVDTVVFRQPVTESTNSTFASALPTRTEPTDNNPTPPDPLGRHDAIVLGDISPSDVGPEFWERLDRYVAERGGTLIIGPGPRGWPGWLITSEVARRLVPVLDPRPVPFDPLAVDEARPFLPAGVAIVPAPSASAEAWPMLQLAAAPDLARSIWDELPRLPWVLAGRPKPAATVLATVAGPGGDDVGSAVIAAQPYGLGKVLWIGTDGTWRWRFRVGDAYHHRFWGQTVRWAASGKLAAGNRLVRFGPDRPRVAEGDTVRLEARFADEAPLVGPDLLVAARVFKAQAKPTNEQAVAVVPLRAVIDQPRAFEGNLPPLSEGAYVVRLDVPQLADALRAEGAPPEAALEVAPRETSERVELAAAREPLDHLASITGGAVCPDAEADSLLKHLQGRTVVRARTIETSLWDRPYAMGLFFALLTIEWLARKKVGLP